MPFSLTMDDPTTRTNSPKARRRPALFLAASALMLTGAMASERDTIEVRRVGTPTLAISDVALDGDDIWLATRGGGVLRWHAGRLERIADVTSGLPSADVLQIDIAPGRGVVAGTAKGLVVIDPQTSAIDTIRPAGSRSTLVDIVATSERGLIAFQTTSPEDLERGPVSEIWLLDADRLQRWADLPDGAHASYGGRDPEGCIVLSGISGGPRNDVWLGRNCGTRPLIQTLDSAGFAPPIGVSAWAEDAASQHQVFALVTQPEPRRPYRFELATLGANDTLKPHVSGWSSHKPIHALFADPARGLLVHAAGHGVVDAIPGPARRYPIDPASRWIGRTASGAYIATAGDNLVRYDDLETSGQTLVQANPGTVFRNSIQLSTCAACDRVLLTSATEGIVELILESDGWHVSRRIDAMRGALPDGTLARAVLLTNGNIAVPVRSRGVAIIDRDGWRWLRPPTQSPNDVIGIAR